jgi:hypothetical protein
MGDPIGSPDACLIIYILVTQMGHPTSVYYYKRKKQTPHIQLTWVTCCETETE